MERLAAAQAAALDHRARVVMLIGEPGIGKSTLAGKLASDAVSADWTVLSGTSFEGGFTPPLWIMTQVTRSALDSPSVIDHPHP